MKPLLLLILSALLAGCGKEERFAGGSAATTGTAMSPSTNESTPGTMVDPKDILFTTSTLNDALPTALGEAAPGTDCFLMHEDDWRQFEFVSGDYDAAIAAELADIDKIWKEQSVPLGTDGVDGTAFKKVHVRSRILQPLDLPMTLAELETLFGGKSSPITIRGYPKVLKDVYAIRLERVILYAAIHNGRMTTLGIDPEDPFHLPAPVADRLEKLVTENSLRLVHWRSRTLMNSPQKVMRYLRDARR